MNKTLVLATKEFQGYFRSWLAYIFIAIFVTASVVTFFYLDPFFSNGRAEVRGFFSWLPLTLALLIPGLTMRQWARENELGSIELLMTLPATTGELVLGKFLGTLGFVCIALLFTLGIPLTADSFGALDWGPVLGGYAAAVLLGAVYVALGLFISSCCSDQFPALLVGWLSCGLLAAVSHDTVLAWATPLPDSVRETMSFVGLWERFRAIERGVIDFSDIAYYILIAAVFISLNIASLRARRYA